MSSKINTCWAYHFSSSILLLLHQGENSKRSWRIVSFNKVAGVTESEDYGQTNFFSTEMKLFTKDHFFLLFWIIHLTCRIFNHLRMLFLLFMPKLYSNLGFIILYENKGKDDIPNSLWWALWNIFLPSLNTQFLSDFWIWHFSDHLETLQKLQLWSARSIQGCQLWGDPPPIPKNLSPPAPISYYSAQH